jgi:hypothetical protein
VRTPCPHYKYRSVVADCGVCISNGYRKPAAAMTCAIPSGDLGCRRATGATRRRSCSRYREQPPRLAIYRHEKTLLRVHSSERVWDSDRPMTRSDTEGPILSPECAVSQVICSILIYFGTNFKRNSAYGTTISKILFNLSILILSTSAL